MPPGPGRHECLRHGRDRAPSGCFRGSLDTAGTSARAAICGLGLAFGRGCCRAGRGLRLHWTLAPCGRILVETDGVGHGLCELEPAGEAPMLYPVAKAGGLSSKRGARGFAGK